MTDYMQAKILVNCQKGKSVELDLAEHGGKCEKESIRVELSEFMEDECRIGTFRLSILNETLSDKANLAMEHPIQVTIPVQNRPAKITAMYMFNPWWTRPAFVERFQDIPDRTQIAFFQYEYRFVCFVPMVGKNFKTYMTSGTKTDLCLEMTACMGGQSQVEEPLYLIAEADSVAEAVHKAFSWLAKAKGIRLREQRRIPEMFHYLGWCSWDAFRTEVTEEKLRQKANELAEKQVPVNWMLIDDGWFSAQDKMISSFAPDKEKFPNGFKGMIEDIRKSGTVQWFGVWHALGGYWDGVAPESELASRESAYLCRTVNGTVVPSPQTGAGFFDHWYHILAQEGIDFVKVDGQSATPHYFENSQPLSLAARGMNQALESGACRMDNAIINCMGMAMENILVRPVSAISRNSDDFVPDRENGFVEHLLQNAYNAVYHNELYCCDWDMFWTRHEDAVKHSLLRAISGGPVYFSDRIGDTVPEVLKPLAYMDGRLLMMDRSAKPTADCIFSDPTKEGVLKLHNVAPWGDSKGGGIAAYNLTDRQQSFTFTPADIPDLPVCGQYWVYDYFSQRARSIGRNEVYEDTVAENGLAWYVILPHSGKGTCLGLLDKYVGFSAVECVQKCSEADIMILHETGTVGFACDVPPQKVMINMIDVTGQLTKDNNLYTLSLSETAERAVLSLSWQ